MRHADQIFAISEAAAENMSGLLDLPRAHIHVTPLAANAPSIEPAVEAVVRSELRLGDARVLLSVAQKRPYKNLRSLIGALPDLDEDVVLVLPGASTPHEQELKELAEQLAVASRVRFIDWLTDPRLESLYAISSAFVLPSEVEGFGLPVLEAMIRGVPVACSNVPALVEVAGDAALMFDPHRQEEVTAAIRRLLCDRALARRLVEAGRARAAEFTWRRTAETTLEGYRRAIASRV